MTVDIDDASSSAVDYSNLRTDHAYGLDFSEAGGARNVMPVS